MISTFAVRIKVFLFGILFLGVCFSQPSYASYRDLDKAVRKMAKKLCEGVKSTTTIAIPSFLTIDKKNTQLGYLVSEELLDQFADNPKWVPVERDFMYEVSQEIKLEMTGAIDRETVKQIGKFSGANYIVVGLLQEIGDEIHIHASLVNVETARVEKATHVLLKATPEIQSLFFREIKMEAKQEQEPKQAVSPAAEGAVRSQPPAPQSSEPPQVSGAPLVLSQDDYEMHYKPGIPDRRQEEEFNRKNEDWYRKRENELNNVDRKLDALNAQAVSKDEEKEKTMDREADHLWKKHQDDYTKMINGVNRPAVTIYSLHRRHAPVKQLRRGW